MVSQLNEQSRIIDELQRRLDIREQQKAKYGSECPPHIITEIEDIQQQIATVKSSPTVAILLIPPQPNFVHPYPLQQNFTGRRRERKLLTTWLNNDTKPIFVLNAIGGMGKSALAWAWLLSDVLGQSVSGVLSEFINKTPSMQLPETSRPEGVLWWSFYESNATFSVFLDEALSYASDRKLRLADLPSTHEKIRALLSILQQRRLLLVLDGFERQLRAYSNMGAAYQGDMVAEELGFAPNDCVDPYVANLLKGIASTPIKSRILITTRLFPKELTDLAGCEREDLANLPPDDIVAFFQAQGVRGTRAEILAACAPYGYHALALRLLTGVVKNDRRRPNDIRVADKYAISSALKGKEQHHILQVAFDVLDKPKQNLLSKIAAFRNPMSLEAINILNHFASDQRFENALFELEERGLLFFDKRTLRYDLHPVVRSYAYDRLKTKTTIHSRLGNYFAAIPTPNEDAVQSLDELMPVIELFHHTVRAGQYERAAELCNERLRLPLYYRFGAYHLYIELLSGLFLSGEELVQGSFRLWAITALGSSYRLIGQQDRALALFQKSVEIIESMIRGKSDTEFSDTGLLINLGICLGNLTYVHLERGELKDAEAKALHRIALCKESGVQFWEVVANISLSMIRIFQGQFKDAESLLAVPFELLEKSEVEGTASRSRIWLSNCLHYRTLCFLLNGDEISAVATAELAKQQAEQWELEPEIMRAIWLQGKALIQIANSETTSKLNTLSQAEACLNDALNRCRRLSLIESEADILLSWAEWHWVSGNIQQAFVYAEEALEIADRCQYRLKQADIHNHLAQLHLERNESQKAQHHAQAARSYALCDGSPYCYKAALDQAEDLLTRLQN